MSRGSTPLRVAAFFRNGVRRGGIAGGVAILHLTLLTALRLSPSGHHASSQHLPNDVLQIRFFPRSVPPSVAHHAAVATHPPRTHHVARHADSPAVAHTAPRPSDMTAPPVAITIPDYLDATPGGRPATTWRPGKPRLPGSDAPLRTGIRLQEESSMRDVVRNMTVGNRCKYERMKMQASTTQFITPHLVARALEADGCGPHGESPEVDAEVEAISRKAIFGN